MSAEGKGKPVYLRPWRTGMSEVRGRGVANTVDEAKKSGEMEPLRDSYNAEV